MSVPKVKVFTFSLLFLFFCWPLLATSTEEALPLLEGRVSPSSFVRPLSVAIATLTAPLEAQQMRALTQKVRFFQDSLSDDTLRELMLIGTQYIKRTRFPFDAEGAVLLIPSLAQTLTILDLCHQMETTHPAPVASGLVSSYCYRALEQYLPGSSFENHQYYLPRFHQIFRETNFNEDLGGCIIDWSLSFIKNTHPHPTRDIIFTLISAYIRNNPHEYVGVLDAAREDQESWEDDEVIQNLREYFDAEDEEEAEDRRYQH